jgi:translation elongation factor EF-Tu-like GTPase
MTADFRFLVEDVFTITGRGTVYVGLVESGEVVTGDLLRVERPGGDHATSRCVVQFLCGRPPADGRDRTTLLLPDVPPGAIVPGDVIRAASG